MQPGNFVHREGGKKRTSQGRRKGVKKASMNKSKKRSWKAYARQGK
jgi:hypothetical protein